MSISINSNLVKFTCKDALDLNIEEKSIDLVITSPPYWGVDPFRYGGDYRKQINYSENKKEFLSNLLYFTKSIYKILKNDGSMLINIGLIEDVAFRYIVHVLDETEFILKETLIWDLSDTLNKTEKIKNSIQPWFHLSKTNNPYINPFMIKKNSGTILKFPPNNNDGYLNNLGFHGDSFPEEMIDFMVKMYSKPRSTLLDPFGGSGVLAVSGLKNNCNVIINDISETQLNLAKSRVDNFIKNKSTGII